MSLQTCRKLAAQIHQHMQQLNAEGVTDSSVIRQRMDSHYSDLRTIHSKTISDAQRVALFQEFPEAFRYSCIVLEGFNEARQQNEPSPHDVIDQFSQHLLLMCEQLLTSGASIELCYHTFHAHKNRLGDEQANRDELKPMYQEWLSSVRGFREEIKEDLHKFKGKPEVLASLNQLEEIDNRMQQQLATLEK